MPKKKIPERPRRNCEQVKTVAVNQVIEKVAHWNGSVRPDFDRLQSVLVACFDEDTGVFAEKLHRRGWVIKKGLVDILNLISVSAAHDLVVAEWVKFYQITVPYDVGDMVATTRCVKARVSAIRPVTAELVLEIDGDRSVGHVIPVEAAVYIAGAVGGAVA